MNKSAIDQGRLTGYLGLIRGNENFRWLWFGQIVSLLGDWFNLIASAALIAQLTQSGMAVSGLFVVRFLAPFLISPLAGVWADRYNRRTLLIICDLLRAVTVLGFLLVREPGHVWLIYTLTAVQLAISGVFYPSRNGILPDIVERNELGAANALSSSTWSVMLAIGAALGGLAAGAWGIYPAFVIDALTFVVSAVLISRIDYHPVSSEISESSIGATLRQYLDGLRYLKAHPDILAIGLVKASASLTVNGAFQVLQVVIAEEIFVIGEEGGISLGAMYVMVGVGTGFGPIFARWLTGDRDRPMRVAIMLGYLTVAVGLLIVGTLSHFGVVLVGTLFRGVGVGINWVFSTQLLLQLLPDQVRGRVFSTEFALLTLGNAISAAVCGWALDNTALGAAGIAQIMGIIVLVPGLLWTLWEFVLKPRRT